MSHDGCKEVEWKGQAFPYLMHHPNSMKTENYGSARAAASGGGHGHGHGGAAATSSGTGSDTTQRSGTGTWLGPAPRGQAQDAQPAAAAAAAPPKPVREPETVLLSNGGRIPLMGLGTYKMASPDSVKAALDLGYRHLDCASFYANQEVIGAGIKGFLAGGRRDELFITSKVWQDEHRPEAARASVLRTLRALGVERLDLLLVHWPEAWLPGSTITEWKDDAEATLADTWRGLEALVDEGLVSGLGVSNFSIAQVEELLKIAKHKPLVNQVELHPLLAQRKMVGVLLRQGVVCVAYAPLGSHTADQNQVLEHPVVVEVAARNGRTPAQVLLRYNMQRGVPVIPKASSPPHLAENIAHAFDWRLSNADKAALDALDAGRRFILSPWHEFPPAEEGGVAKPSLVLKSS
ncbi:alcohol dehydrogenase [Raphidocelis subcapitata]|uniref:Alcohol dehydrogenase n=1 Tax=Raphidocelis subcapitata TaxID=307507 RepID=A0A2V0P1D2_9CHLO|nr:alcohol dehydrogenase [Raphidocelis subcapitata]|eukprot:GBF92732.1 alcohol dehydrogenase [Raphidocelis subcapitata]